MKKKCLSGQKDASDNDYGSAQGHGPTDGGTY